MEYANISHLFHLFCAIFIHLFHFYNPYFTHLFHFSFIPSFFHSFILSFFHSFTPSFFTICVESFSWLLQILHIPRLNKLFFVFLPLVMMIGYLNNSCYRGID